MDRLTEIRAHLRKLRFAQQCAMEEMDRLGRQIDRWTMLEFTWRFYVERPRELVAMVEQARSGVTDPSGVS